MRTLMLAALLATQVTVVTGCSWKNRVKLLENDEFDHYYALRVYMEEDDKKAYLKLKTREERDQYLKELSLWDRFYQYPDHIREKIIAGEVQEGWTRDMVYMSWGKPYDRRKLAGREAQRSEMLIYRFEQHEDGSVLVWAPGSKTEYKAAALFEQEVILDDDVVAGVEIKKKSW